MPLYPFLATELARYLGLDASNLPAGAEFNEVAYRCMAADHAIEDIYPALKTVMDRLDDGALGIPPQLLKLAEIRPFRLFVSTTFDNLLERALNQVRSADEGPAKTLTYAPSAWDDLPAHSATSDPVIVYRLFGKLSATPLSYAITQEDVLEYVHALQSDARQPNLFFDRVTTDSLLLIGNSFDGWLARFFMRAAKRDRFSTTRGAIDYVADRKMRGDDNLVLFLRHFSRGTKFFQGGGAIEFINELHQRWTKYQPQRTTADDKPPVASLPAVSAGKGSVFLSYASEDLDHAKRLFAALDSRGIDVFFDKTDLRAGDNYERELRHSIRSSSLFIPLISRHTLTEQRRFFRIEWREAIKQAEQAAWNSKFVVPVVVDDTAYDAQAVPPEWQDLHWTRFASGQPSDTFIDEIQSGYRRYQKSRLESR